MWGCHWGLSVKEVLARGVIIGRGPDRDRDSRSDGDSVFERIAFVKRGGEPLAVKALSAQVRNCSYILAQPASNLWLRSASRRGGRGGGRRRALRVLRPVLLTRSVQGAWREIRYGGPEHPLVQTPTLTLTDTIQFPLAPLMSIVNVACLWCREGVAIPSYFMLLEHAEALWSATYVQDDEDEEKDEL